MDIIIRTLCSVVLFTSVACQGPTQPISSDTDSPQMRDARADSLELATAKAAQSRIESKVIASIETAPILANNVEDAADDPAIWVHPTSKERSIVFGSNKRGGIAAYDLEGKEVAYYPVGNINNIDVLYRVRLGNRDIDLLGGTNRSDQSIDLFAIDPQDGKLTDIAAGALAVDTSLIDDIYGFCFARYGGEDFVVINGKNGRMEQYAIVPLDEAIDLKLVRSYQFPGQTEGLVADEKYNRLYVGQEDGGIWRMPIGPDSNIPPVLIPKSTASNPDLRYDLEGLTLYAPNDTSGYLIASSQGSFSYALFHRMGDNAYFASFKIVASETIDGAEETDGIDLVTDSLSPAFPHGLFVVQDGYNLDQQERDIPQNFKYVRWEDIEKVIER